MRWALTALRRGLDVAGRSRRREYWAFVLLAVLLFTAAAAIDLSLGYGAATSYAGDGLYGAGFTGSGPAEAMVALLLLIPGVAVSVRRLHDDDRRGWWLLIGVIPIVGATVLIVFFCLEGTRGPNRFGADPKAAP